MNRNLSNRFAALLALMLCLCPGIGLAAGQTAPPQHALDLGHYDEADVAVILEDLEVWAASFSRRSLPADGQLQFRDALALSNAALMAHTGMSEAELLQCSVIPHFRIGEDVLDLHGQRIVMRDPRWVMNYPDYSVYLDATTGEVLAIEGSSGGNG